MVELHSHQEEAAGRLRNGNILWGGVGTGKSLTAAVYYLRNEAPRDVYVITTAKKRDSLDWEDEFVKVGVTGMARPAVTGSLTVDSWNNLRRYREVSGAFFIFDEQRVVGSGGWVRDFIRVSKSNNWILLSATPGDTWLDYIPVFIANGFYRNRTEFKQEHVEYEPYVKFPKIRRYRNVGRLVRLRRQILVEMPYIGRTTRETHIIDVSHDEELMKKVMEKRWNVFEERPLTGVADLFSVMRKVVNSSTSRLAMCRTLMKKHPKLVVFYNFDYELELLRTLVSGPTTKELDGSDQSLIMEESEAWQTQKPVGITLSPRTSIMIAKSPSSSASAVTTFSQKSNLKGETTSSMSTTTSGSTFQLAESERIGKIKNVSTNSNPLESVTIAEWNGHRHQPVPTSDRWVYLVQYAAGAEGWNCTETDAMLFYSLPYSYKAWHQAHGRIDRMNTPFSRLFYYTFMSTSFIDKAIAKCLKNKKDFNASAVMSEIV